MAKNLAQNFVFHGDIGLASHVIAEFCLNHHDRGFNIAAIVVVGEKLFAIEREVVKHLFRAFPY